MSKTSIFADFAYFLDFFSQISGRLGLFWPFNIASNEEEHNSNHLKQFPGETDTSILIKVQKSYKTPIFTKFLAILDQKMAGNNFFEKSFSAIL